jgi:mono/diheme cytochrome c family protein
LYESYCQRCHGADGRGEVKGKRIDDVPDFTRGDWQRKRNDHQLVVSIRDGCGSGMPAFNGKLTDAQIADLVARIRAFVPSDRRPTASEKLTQPTANFDAEYRNLKKEFEDLRRQFRELDDTPRRPM